MTTRDLIFRHLTLEGIKNKFNLGVNTDISEFNQNFFNNFSDKINKSKDECFKEINEILESMPDSTGGRRTMLFSATMTSKVEKLQRASLLNPVRVEVSTKFQTPKKLLQSYLFIPAKYKDCYLTYLINEHAGQSILVFGATCNNVQRLALMLRNLGFPAICLHGQMSQPKRLGALTKFKAGGRDILICTDVASRGLDIPSVDVVINFDLPGHGKDYIHRVGRTARAGRSGKALAMVTQYDVEVYQRLEHL